MILSEKDIEDIEYLYNLLNNGRYTTSQFVTDLYNRVYNRNVKPVNCSTCIRQRILEMKKDKDLIMKELEKSNETNISNKKRNKKEK